MNFTNLKIGSRLGTGFGLVLVTIVVLIAVGRSQLAGIGEITNEFVDKAWNGADASQVLNARIRANAGLTMQLFITDDLNKIAAINREIDENKVVTETALDKLDKLVSQPEGKVLLAKIRASSAAYMASHAKVAQFLAQGDRDYATTALNKETLPALDHVEKQITDLVALQRHLVNERGAEARQVIESASHLMLGVGLIAAFAGISCAYLITRSITRPLREAVQSAQTVASGDLTGRIYVQRRDEIGEVLQALDCMNDSLRKIVCEVREGTDTIAAASTKISRGNEDLSSRTEEQASSLEETVASMLELTSTVKQNADNAMQANRLVQLAAEVAAKGGAVISDVVNTMGAINESAGNIVDITGVIEEIAFQTNILALNAAVEAARAGEHGRGFAVVAGEVRNLAQRCAGATKEIKTIISDSMERVQTGRQLVAEAGATMSEIVTSVQSVTGIMSEITAASQAQSTGIEQINQAMGQLGQVTQQNAALVDEAVGATQSLQDQAVRLVQLIRVFKLD